MTNRKATFTFSDENDKKKWESTFINLFAVPFTNLSKLNLVKFDYRGLVLALTNIRYFPSNVKNWCSLQKQSKMA
jgi:hypothetical protein